MRFKQLAAALGAVALVGAGVIAVAGPASAGGSYPSPSPTCTPSPGIAAWDQTIVDHEAYTDPDTAVPDTWVVDSPAVDETVVDHAAHWQRYSWVGGPIAEGVTPSWSGPDDSNWQANTTSDPHKIGHSGAYDRGNPGHADWFYLEWVPAVTHVVHHAEIGHWEYHPAIPGQHHDAVTHVVHHAAIPPVTCPPPYGYKITVMPFVTVTPPTCDEPGSYILGPEAGVHWSALDGNEPGSIVVTADPAQGYKFPEGAQTQFYVPNLDQLPADSDECYTPPQVNLVVPTSPSVQDECGTANDTYLLPPDGDGIAYSYDEDGHVVATITAENTEWNELPRDWNLEDAGNAVHLGNDDDFTNKAPCSPQQTTTPTPSTEPTAVTTEVLADDPAPTPSATPTAVSAQVLTDTPAPTTSATPVTGTTEVLASDAVLAATGSNGTLAMVGLAALVLLLGTGGVALARRR